MLLLDHEFEFLKRASEFGAVAATGTNPWTTRILLGHRLVRRSGDQLILTALGAESLKTAVVKASRSRQEVTVKWRASLFAEGA